MLTDHVLKDSEETSNENLGHSQVGHRISLTIMLRHSCLQGCGSFEGRAQKEFIKENCVFIEALLVMIPSSSQTAPEDFIC
jgi:hypothetical protein